MAFTQTQLDALDAAIASGAREVRFQDRTVVYQSLAAMLQARTLLYSSLNPAGSAKPIRQIRMYGDSGL